LQQEAKCPSEDSFFEIKRLAMIPQLIHRAHIKENNTIFINNHSFNYALYIEATGACTCVLGAITS
jgi:hypothetical protein